MPPLMIRFNSAGGRLAPRNLGIDGTPLDVRIGPRDDIMNPSRELRARLRAATSNEGWNGKVVVYGHSTGYGSYISDRGEDEVPRFRTGDQLANFIDRDVYGQSDVPGAPRRVKVLSCYTGRAGEEPVLLDDLADEFARRPAPYRAYAARPMVSASKDAEEGIWFMGRKKGSPNERYRVGARKVDRRYPRSWEARRTDKERVLRMREGEGAEQGLPPLGEGTASSAVGAPDPTGAGAGSGAAASVHQPAEELGRSGQELPPLGGDAPSSAVGAAEPMGGGAGSSAVSVHQPAEGLGEEAPEAEEVAGGLLEEVASVAEDALSLI